MIWPATRQEIHFGRLVRCFVDRPLHVGALLNEAVERAPAETAIVAGESRLTYTELDHWIARTASGFVAAGLKPGERIGLLMNNRPDYLVALMAAARSGLIAVPMNVRQRRPEIIYMLADCEAAALIYDIDVVDEVPSDEEAPSVRTRYSVGGEQGPADCHFEDLQRSEGDAPVYQPHEDDPFCILYTSGTTGRPKGAVLTHLGCMHSVLHYQYGLGLNEGEIAALAVPVSHVTGLIAIFLLTLRLAGTIVVMRDFRAGPFLELVERERITYTLMVPAMYKLCLLHPGLAQFDLSCWRVGGFGGEPMAAATIEELAAAIPSLGLSNIYGATETSSPATILAPGFPIDQRMSVGSALPCSDIVVVDNDGHEAAGGDHGEILIGGPTVVPHYWENPAADAAAFVGGYWRSGDIGSVDAEGRVFIHDRIKDMINRGGYKVYCAEVENVLLSYPGVRECAVIGVPDPVLGERVHAFLVADELDAHAFKLWCKDRLSNYKIPEFATRLSEPLPRNANGKVLRNALRDRVANLA